MLIRISWTYWPVKSSRNMPVEKRKMAFRVKRQIPYNNALKSGGRTKAERGSGWECERKSGKVTHRRPKGRAGAAGRSTNAASDSSLRGTARHVTVDTWSRPQQPPACRRERSGECVCAGERTADCQLTSSLSARVLVYYPESDIDLGVAHALAHPCLDLACHIARHHHVLSYLCLRIHHKIIPVEPHAVEVTWNTLRLLWCASHEMRTKARPNFSGSFTSCWCSSSALDFPARRGILMHRLPPLD